MKSSLLFPIGVLVAGSTTKTWIRVADPPRDTNLDVRPRWRPLGAASPVSEAADHVLASFGEPGIDVEVSFVAPPAGGDYELQLVMVASGSESESPLLAIPVKVIDARDEDAYLLTGLAPLSAAWGVDRGVPVHRLHLEQFLADHAPDIRGRCLEFQEPRYVPRLGGVAVDSLDILHLDDSNPRATLVGDLTRANNLPGDRFDCIVCTHVLQSVFDLPRAVAELHRLLAPGGVLLVSEPQVAMCDPRYGELWRFTQEGLGKLLTSVFDPVHVEVRAFGNSLTAAGELRGRVSIDFPPDVLAHHDSRFAAEICARAVKPRAVKQ